MGLVLGEGKCVAQVARDLDLRSRRSGAGWSTRWLVAKGRRGMNAKSCGDCRRKSAPCGRSGGATTSRGPLASRTTREVRVHPVGEGLLQRASDVSGSPGLAERVLRVAGRAGLGPWATDPQLRVLIRASQEASRSRCGNARVFEGPAGSGRGGQPQAGGAVDAARGRARRARKRFRATAMSEDDQPVAAKVLDRDFVADAPNQRGIAGTSEFVNRSIGTATRRSAQSGRRSSNVGG